MHALAYETIMENEEDQVNGVVHYVDGAGVSFPYLTLFTPREAVRIAKNAEVKQLYINKVVLDELRVYLSCCRKICQCGTSRSLDSMCTLE
jgi:hypothetical protein